MRSVTKESHCFDFLWRLFSYILYLLAFGNTLWYGVFLRKYRIMLAAH